MLVLNNTILANALCALKHSMINAGWVAAIDQAAHQLVTCKTVCAINDKALIFRSRRSHDFAATAASCENPTCCQHRGGCEHRMMALVFSHYRIEERKIKPLSEIVYRVQLNMNADNSITISAEGKTKTLTAREAVALYAFSGFQAISERLDTIEHAIEAQEGCDVSDD